jgi:hypothetical protein
MMSSSDFMIFSDEGNCTNKLCEFGRLCISSVANVYCSTCGVNLCSTCSNAIHSIQSYKEHSIVDLVPLDIEIPAPTICQVPGCLKIAAFSCTQCKGGDNLGQCYVCAEHDAAVHVFSSHHRRLPG